VKGTVTRVQPFGAFVELAPGIEGLIHVSELGAGRRVTHPREVLNPGDAVEAMVVGVDTSKRRIGLSLDPARMVDAVDAEARQAYSAEVPSARGGETVGSFGELLRESLEMAKRRR
jgi:small subunit ribosomal protein S1